jgi:hypothetical protein
MKVRAAIFVALLIVALVGCGGAEAGSHRQIVRGGFLAPVPCAVTSIDPSGAFSCTSVEVWDGVWNGVNHYTASGHIDVLTGDVHARVDETFTGVALPEQTSGTLHLFARVDVDGATNAQHVDARIVGGTGDFTGSSGRVSFDGVQISGLVGHGGYSGVWCLGRPACPHG